MQSNNLAVGARIRLGAAGDVTTADTLGPDTYTIASISGTTITLAEYLTQDYTGSTLHRGLVSEWADKSGNGNNATQTDASRMPLWLKEGINGNDTIYFDGVMNGDFVSVNYSLNGTQTFFLNATRYQQTTHTGSCCRPIISSSSNNGKFIGVLHDDLAPNDAVRVSWWNAGSNYTATGSWQLGDSIIIHAYMGDNGPNNLAYSHNGDVPTVATNTSTPSGATSTIGGTTSGSTRYFHGNISDVIVYNAAVSETARHLIEQYQSAKWDIALTPPGTGATETAKAMASDGYSVFTTHYLERLSQSADISLQATNSITLDLQGDTLALASDRNFSLATTNGNISSVSSGTIITTRTGSGGNIMMTAGGSGAIDVSNLTLNANNGGAINLASSGAMTLGAMNAGSILARSTGVASDLTIALGTTLSASGAGNAITLVAGRNFINNAGNGALSATSGRWLVYSTHPASDALGGLASDFRRFSCTYGGSCPAFPASGNGYLYSHTPILTVTPSVLELVYGSAAPSLTGYAYTLSGYLGSDAASDSVAGSLNGSTPYTTGSHAGQYTISYMNGSLASALGYGFTYNDNAIGINVVNGINAAKLNAGEMARVQLSQQWSQITPGFVYSPSNGHMEFISTPRPGRTGHQVELETLAPSSSGHDQSRFHHNLKLTIWVDKELQNELNLPPTL